jgi:hypothetical protein
MSNNPRDFFENIVKGRDIKRRYDGRALSSSCRGERRRPPPRTGSRDERLAPAASVLAFTVLLRTIGTIVGWPFAIAARSGSTGPCVSRLPIVST